MTSLVELLKDRDAAIRVRAHKLLASLHSKNLPADYRAWKSWLDGAGRELEDRQLNLSVVKKKAHADPSRPDRPDTHGD